MQQQGTMGDDETPTWVMWTVAGFAFANIRSRVSEATSRRKVRGWTWARPNGTAETYKATRAVGQLTGQACPGPSAHGDIVWAYMLPLSRGRKPEMPPANPPPPLSSPVLILVRGCKMIRQCSDGIPPDLPRLLVRSWSSIYLHAVVLARRLERFQDAYDRIMSAT